MYFNWIGQSKDGKTVTLQRIVGCPITLPEFVSTQWLEQNNDSCRNGCALHIRTVRLSSKNQGIVEIALRRFTYHHLTGQILSLNESYSAFQEAPEIISKEASELNQISTDMLAGQKIDWSIVDEILSRCDLIISHDAAAVRPFIDLNLKISREKIWSCSNQQITWSHLGVETANLELITIYHGFFPESRRSLDMVNALLYLLSKLDPDLGNPYLMELMIRSSSPAT